MSQREIERAQVHWEKLSDNDKESYKSRAKSLGSKVVSSSFYKQNFINEASKEDESKMIKLQDEVMSSEREIESIIKDALDVAGKFKFAY